MNSIACVIVAKGGKNARDHLLTETILPSVLAQRFEEVVVVGTYQPGDGYRYLHVPALTDTTVDALIKRDVGALATTSDTILFLADDHALDPGFRGDLGRWLDQPWDVLSPSRYTVRDGNRMYLNMGKGDHYIGGHGILVRRTALRLLPWMAIPPSLIWDRIWTHRIAALGARVVWAQDNELAIVDVEPGATPWV